MTYLICYYRPQRSWGTVMFLHVSEILFTGGGEVDPLYAGIHTPPRSEAGTTSLEQTLPGTRHPPQDLCTAPRADLPRTRHPPEQPPPGAGPPKQAPLLSRQPTPQGSACWEIRGNKRAVRILLECNLVYVLLALW